MAFVVFGEDSLNRVKRVFLSPHLFYGLDMLGQFEHVLSCIYVLYVTSK